MKLERSERMVDDRGQRLVGEPPPPVVAAQDVPELAAAVLSFVAPSALLGVGLILLWNRPWLRPVYGSLAILVVAYAARYAVIGVRPIAAAISHGTAGVEEAAAAVGAGFYDTVMWMGPILQKANADDRKPDFNKFI